MASIKKRPDGKWRARYRDEQGKEHTRHFARKVDGQAWLDEVTTSVVSGMYVDPNAGKVKFSDYYAAWSARQLWAPGTRRAMDLATRGVPFAGMQIKAIRRSHVEEWIKSLDHLAPGTVKTRYNNVRQVFRGAVSDRLIATDPTDGVTLPRVRRVEAAMSIPTTEQVGRLLESAEEVFKAFLAVCAFAGLRMGEACGLRPGDIDYGERTIRIARQIQRETGGSVEVRGPKYGSERTVYIPQQLCDLLSKHVANHSSDEWVFPGENGLPWHQNTAGHYWRKARTKVGVSFTLHELRHYFASGLIDHGASVVTVQRALGHQSATVTLNTYAHLWPTAEDRTRAASADMMRAAVSSTEEPPFYSDAPRITDGDSSGPQGDADDPTGHGEGEATGGPADGPSEAPGAD